MRKPLGQERGVALIMVVVAIAILTAVATDFAYNSRVDLELAANQRDELQAEYLAESGIAMSRLLLRFQKQVDSIQLPNIGGLLQKLIPGAAGAGANAGNVPAPQGLNIQLWRMAHVDCHMLEGMVPPAKVEGSLAPKGRASVASRGGKFDQDFPELAASQKQMSFGTFSGCFNAVIEDEEQKLNVNQLNARASEAQVAGLRMRQLFTDKRFEFVFEHEDASHVKVQPDDIMLAMKDWVDDDQTASALNRSGTGDLFVPGTSDEAALYDRYLPRYHPKNGLFLSVDELYMVYGVTDLFMAAFRDRLTVYPEVETALNINSDDPLMMYMAILSVADPIRPDPRLRDPAFVDAIIQRIRQARVFSFFGMSVRDFVNVVQSAGVAVNTTITATQGTNNWVSDKSSTFRIKSTGQSGRVERTVETVIKLDNGLGKLLYWREG